MPNIELVKSWLKNQDLIVSIHDIFSLSELDQFENEIIVYDFEDLCQIDENLNDGLNDAVLVSDYRLDDVLKITNDLRIEHGLFLLDNAAKKYHSADIISQYVQCYKTVDVGGVNFFVCYQVWCENAGMGLYMDYESAVLVGVFKAIDEIYEYYESLGKFCDDKYDNNYLDKKMMHIRENWHSSELVNLDE